MAFHDGLVRFAGYFVIELKTGKFQPEYAGKLNFYIVLVDDRLRREAHAVTVGILICGSKMTTPSGTASAAPPHPWPSPPTPTTPFPQTSATIFRTRNGSPQRWTGPRIQNAEDRCPGPAGETPGRCFWCELPLRAGVAARPHPVWWLSGCTTADQPDFRPGHRPWLSTVPGIRVS